MFAHSLPSYTGENDLLSITSLSLSLSLTPFPLLGWRWRRLLWRRWMLLCILMVSLVLVLVFSLGRRGPVDLITIPDMDSRIPEYENESNTGHCLSIVPASVESL